MATGGGYEDRELLPSAPPAICRHFNAPTGCTRPGCDALHVCYYFVTGKCRFGNRCRLPHSLETERTVGLLRRLGWTPSRRQLVQLLTELQHRHRPARGGGPTAGGPRVCLHYNRGACLVDDCACLHLCYPFVMGRCRGRQCRRRVPLSHSLTSVHNAHILQSCGLRDAAFSDVLSRLRERPLRPSVCRRYNSKEGCRDPDCLQLHCCFYYARGDCAYGLRCRLKHKILGAYPKSGGHNREVLHFFGLDVAGALLAVREDICSAEETTKKADPTPQWASAVADAIVGQVEVARLKQQQANETARLLDERDKLEKTLFKVTELNTETERELADTRKEKTALQVEAEHVSLVAQDQEQQFSAQHRRMLAERDSLELSLQATAESSEEYQNIVTGLNEKLSDLEVDFRRTQEERQRLAAERQTLAEERQRLAEQLEQERRRKREEQERREEELERTLVCSVCLEMFVTATTLGCSHTFCNSCVASVQRRIGLCPMCRAVIQTKTRSITLDQMVARAVQTMSREKRAARQAVLNQRGVNEQII